MGRKSSVKEKRVTIEEHYGWPWKLTIELPNFTLEKERICFLSGKERGYFPEDPGTSRHGVEYAMNCHPGDTPNPSYVPSEDRLQKPISLKGYGIGGLSAPRFPTQHHVEARPRSNRKSKFRKSEAVTPITTEYNHHTHLHHKHVHRSKRNRIPLCRPAYAFGLSNTLPRFGYDHKFQNVGVGHYDIQEICLCKKIAVDTNFGRCPAKIIAPTKTYCNYDGYDECIECEFELVTIDYYRSRRPIPVPDYRQGANTADSDEPLKMRSPRFVAICRQCYCYIIHNGHRHWTKDRLKLEFQKTRHCINTHEHNEFPVCIHKVPCKLSCGLTRTEARMTKHFSDRCPKIIRQVA